MQVSRGEGIASHTGPESCGGGRVRIKPEHAGALNNLAVVLSGQGRLAEVIACRRKFAELRPGSAAAGSALLSTLHYAASSTPGMLLEIAREWAVRHAGAALTRGHGDAETRGKDVLTRGHGDAETRGEDGSATNTNGAHAHAAAGGQCPPYAGRPS